MRFYLLLPFAIAANPPDHPLPSQTKVYGHPLLVDQIPSSDEVALNFIDRVYSYPKDQFKMFNVITSTFIIHDNRPMHIPDFITKENLDTVLGIFENDPVIDMMNAEAFSHILRVAEYLEIAENDERDYLQDFFSCVCRHSILGTHCNEILNTRLYEFHSSVAKGNIAYTQIARALANIFGLQVKILGEERTDPKTDPETDQEPDFHHTLLFHTPSCQYPKEHKVLGFGASIDTIKITPAALSKIETQDDPLHIILWLFDHTDAEALDLSGCFVSGDILAKIANMDNLEVLNLSCCGLQRNTLVPIGNSPVLQNKLRELHAVGNKFGLNDTKALALLTLLEILNLSYCKLQRGTLVPIGNSSTLQKKLRELHADGNNFYLNDTTALAPLAFLEILRLSNCGLQPGSLVPIGNSPTLQKKLRELYADGNEFDLNDTIALALLTLLEILNLLYCKLQRGTLVPIGNSPALQDKLRELHLVGNNFDLNDTTALAPLAFLETLDLSYCNLPLGALIPIGNSPALLKKLLRLNVTGNQNLGPEDQRVITKFQHPNAVR